MVTVNAHNVIEEIKVSDQATKRVNGKVVDKIGEPIIGANIVVLDGSSGVITDIDGNFSIDVPNNAKLKVSFIGYISQILDVTYKSTLNVVLIEDSQKIDEVVVVGYGTQKKVSLTGAVEAVSNDIIESRPITNLTAGLQGTMAGVTIQRTNGQPGAEGYNIQIRGASSVNGSNPLILIDGIEGDMNLINPNDVESISVLKDVSTAAIYGSRSAGGVILVTTKQGKKNNSFKINYQGSIAFDTPTTLPEFPSAVDDYKMRVEAGYQKWGGSRTPDPVYIQKLEDPNIIALDDNKDGYWEYYANTDWIDECFKKWTTTQSHNLSISGGGQKTNFYASFGFYGQDGILRYGPDKNNRYNVRLNLNSEIKKWFSIEAKLSYDQNVVSRTNMDASANLFHQLYEIPPTYPVYNPDGKYAGMGGWRNPIAMMKEGGEDRSRNDMLTGNISLIFEPIQDLKIRLIGGAKYGYTDRTQEYRTIDWWGVNEIVGKYQPQNQIKESPSFSIYTTSQLVVDYVKSFNDSHNISLMTGLSQEYSRYKGLEAIAYDMPTNDSFALSLGNPSTKANDSSYSQYGIISYFARANYDFQNKYLLGASVRVDGSSRFAKGNRWAAFPSVSVGWRVAEEHFMDDFEFIDDLKLRASWGQVGNQAGLSDFEYLAILSHGGYIPFNSNEKGKWVFQNTLVSNDRTWERISSTNIGIDLAFLSNRLTFTADYYYKLNNSMFVDVNIPSAIGIGVPKFNGAELEIKGWEISVGWKDRIKDFGYFVNFNLADNTNKVLKYESSSTISLGYNRIIEGRPMNEYWGYVTDGYYQNEGELKGSALLEGYEGDVGVGDIRYKDLDGDGKISSTGDGKKYKGDLVSLGTSDPRYTYGINLGFDYKGFDFSIFFQGVGKRTLFPDRDAFMPLAETWSKPLAIALDHWTEDNRNAAFPRLSYNAWHNYVRSDKWAKDGSYIRLKNLQVGYTIPRSLCNKIGIESLRIYFSGQNLWEHTKFWKDWDPEIEFGTGGFTVDSSSRTYPFSRTLSGGINLTF